MSSHEQFLDDYEISHLLCDSDDCKDDRHREDDIGCPKEEQISCPPFITPSCSDSEKPEIIEFCNKTKGAVDMLHQMCARYTVQRANRRWIMAMFYGMTNIAAVNALVIHAHDMWKDQSGKKIKRKDFLLRIAHDLVKPFVTQQYKLPTLPRNIKTAIVMCGFVSESEENAMKGPEDYEAISRKRGRCHVFSRNRGVKTQFVCKGCGHYVCKDHLTMIVTCETC